MMKKRFKKNVYVLLAVVAMCLCSMLGHGQQISDEVTRAMRADDAKALAELVKKEEVNTCYGNYTLLDHAVRFGYVNCFRWLLDGGADVNLACGGYLPPLFFAAKYGRLEMARELVKRGAKVDVVYSGKVAELKGQTPLAYAEFFKMKEVADYLKSVKK